MLLTVNRACPHCGARHPASLSRCPVADLPIGGDPGLVGSTIAGRYHLVRLLGDGGMGAVYKAADQVLRRFVAIKLLHASVARNPSSVERFQREARAAAAIGHPNIIDILDFGIEEKRPYMVMEYLRGRSLSQIIATDGALPVRRACVIATHTLAGLAAAHDRGILHRDLKPANLMLVARFGDRNFVKVCDFGFAALFGGGGRNQDARILTPERTLVGTPAYAAPERLRGDDRRDPRTDVYSVGVLLFEMLAGQRPFDAPTFAELARKVRNESAPALRSLRRDVSPELERVVARALAKTPAERWTNAEELAAALVPFGGRSVDVEDDAPSDSYTFEMMRIKARDTRKRVTRPSSEDDASVREIPRAKIADWPRTASVIPRPKPRSNHPGRGRRSDAPEAMPSARNFRPETVMPTTRRSDPFHSARAGTSDGSLDIPIEIDEATDRGAADDATMLMSAAHHEALRAHAAQYAAQTAAAEAAGAAARATAPLQPELARPPGVPSQAPTSTVPSVSPNRSPSFPPASAHRSGFPPPIASSTPAGGGAEPLESASEALRSGSPGMNPGPMVRGALVVSVLRFVARKYGERALKELLASLPSPTRETFDVGVPPNGWVELDVLAALIERIDAQLGEDDLHMVLECGRAAAEGAFEIIRNFSATSKVPPELLLSDLPQIGQRLLVGITLEIRRLGRGYSRIELLEAGRPSLTLSVVMLGFLERSLERFGAEDVEVNLIGARALEDPQTMIDVSWIS